LFDDAILDRVAIDDTGGRDAMSLASHIVFGGSMAYRVVDSLILPLVVHDDSDLALQMSVTDLEAFGTVAAVLWGSHVFVARERPVVTRRCDDPSVAEDISQCDPDSRDRARSFIAGHLATVVAATGLTCLHHARIPLYGGGIADTLACGTMFVASGFSAVSRVTTEAHYPSDVLFGVALGTVAGWVVPMALHYGFGSSPESDVAVRVLPWLGEQQTGLLFVGHF
jgi:membrane-associated phospholipid phosphatase